MLFGCCGDRQGDRSEKLPHAIPKLDWQFVFDDLDLRFKQLHNKLDHVQERSWEDQTEIHDKVAKLNNDLYKLIAQL